MLLIWFQALPSVRIAVLFAFRHTDIASRKIPRQGRVTAVGNDGNRGAERVIRRGHRQASDRRLQWWSRQVSHRQ